MRRIGVMGGTFDPVHYGHLVAAEGARYELELEKVFFVPSGRPPHKPCSAITEPAHRLSMTALACASNPFFTVLDLEIKRPGLSYTYDTITDLQRELKPEQIFFITGADAIQEILTWHRVQELLQMCFFVAVRRPGYNLASLNEKLSKLPEHLMRRIIPFATPELAISSSDIRSRVREGRPIKYLLPETVEAYIMTHGLYR
ncbi:nicotinate-nucleotide adenylyltransferase [Desulforudis sp. 1088]|uniref:nicotinate-nucleotide adenylyltransferase n=2 Tax=Candidatus Desulforudis TaxID=471826 RepID=UPI003CE5C677